MDISAITALNSVNGTATVSPASLTGMLAEKEKKAEGTMFETFLNTAIDNVKITNSYLSDAENEKIRFALGETDNTHDLTIAMEKASTALQYTVAIRDKVMEAYKELMQIQIERSIFILDVRGESCNGRQIKRNTCENTGMVE